MTSKNFEGKGTPPQKQAHLNAFSIASPGMLGNCVLILSVLKTGKTSSRPCRHEDGKLTSLEQCF
jgi:hypothetical protein